MKLPRFAMIVALCLGAVAQVSSSRAEAPAMPVADQPLMVVGKFEKLGSVRKGGTFSVKVQVVNGLVHGLPKLTVTVAGDGVKLRSAASKVFKGVVGNGGTVVVVIKGKLLKEHGSLHLVASTGIIDDGVGPFELKQDIAVGTAP